jgi:hypothetical protein
MVCTVSERERFTGKTVALCTIGTMHDYLLRHIVKLHLGGQKTGEKMARYEVTESVNRLEAIEANMNIAFEGIFAVLEGPDDDGDYRVEINFEVVSTGADLGLDFQVIFVAYADNGQVVGQDTSWISASTFIGIQPLAMSVYVKKLPVKFRLYPQVS